MTATITPLPTPVPQTSDPTNFATRADAFLAALPNFATEATALAAAVNAESLAAAGALAAAAAAIAVTGYVATCSTSLSLAAQTSAITFNESGKSFANGNSVLFISKADPTKRMYGTLSGVSGTAATLTVASGGVSGSGGPYTDWVVLLAVFASTEATGADILAGISRVLAVTPAGLADSVAEYALTDAATITPDLAVGRNFAINPIGGNRTLANPNNMVVGQSGVIRVVQDGTGSRTLSFGSYWKRDGGAPTLSTAAGAEDFLVYQVVSATKIVYDFIQAPS